MKKFLYPLAICMVIASGLGAQAIAGGDADSRAEAEAVLHRMSDFLAGAEQFRFTAEIVADEFLFDGVRVQRSWTTDVLVRRPDRLQVTISELQPRKRIWYDGKTWTISFLDEGFYAQTQVPGTIDKAMDAFMDEFGLDLPVADFVYSQPYEVLTEMVQDGFHTGLQKVNGTICHHLVFIQENIDWQIWIADGNKPVPCKLAITHKNDPGSPQVTALMSNWNLATPAPDILFKFEPSLILEKIEFMTLSEIRASEGGQP